MKSSMLKYTKFSEKLFPAKTNILKLNDSGIPAFLLINPYKDVVRGDLKILIEPIIENLKSEEKKFIEAHYKVIDTMLCTIHNEHDSAQVNHAIICLRKIWSLAYKWKQKHNLHAISGSIIPEQVKILLNPLMDPVCAKNIIDVITHYDIDSLEDEIDLEGLKQGDLDNVIRDFTTHVIVPLCLITYCKTHNIILDDDFLAIFNENPHLEETPFNTLLKKLTPKVKKILFKDRSIDKVVGLTLSGYPAIKFPDRLMRMNEIGSWHALTQDTTIVCTAPGTKDITIYCLTTSNEMEREGILMHHCTHAHVVQCCNGDEHFFSIRKANQEIPLSTIMVTKDKKSGDFIIYDTEGPERPDLGVIPQGQKKHPPVPEAIEAANWFINALNSNKIMLNRHRGETDESKKQIPNVIRKIGYRLNEENVENAFYEYCHNSKRRSAKYNVKSGQFDLRSKTTHLISGNHIQAIKSDDGSSFVVNTGFRKLKAMEWFKVSGMKAETIVEVIHLLNA